MTPGDVMALTVLALAVLWLVLGALVAWVIGEWAKESDDDERRVP